MQDAMLRRLQEMAMGGTPPIVPGGMGRRRGGPTFNSDIGGSNAPVTRPRRPGGADAATVALAMSGLSLYWTLPAMLANPPRKRRRRTRPRQQPQQ